MDDKILILIFILMDLKWLDSKFICFRIPCLDLFYMLKDLKFRFLNLLLGYILGFGSIECFYFYFNLLHLT